MYIVIPDPLITSEKLGAMMLPQAITVFCHAFIIINNNFFNIGLSIQKQLTS